MKKNQDKSAGKNEAGSASSAGNSGSHMRIQKRVIRSTSITRIAPKSTLKKKLNSKL